MFEVPGSDITTVIINEKVVKGDESASYIRKQQSEKDEADADEDSGCEDDEELTVRQS